MATHFMGSRFYGYIALAMAAVVFVATGGCLNFKPRKDATRYFVLTVEEDTAAGSQETEDTTGLRLGILPIEVAAHLRTPRMAIRSGDNEILYSDYHRWGEGLAAGVGRVVKQKLAEGEDVRAVYIAPWAEASERDYDIRIEILRFEGARHVGASQGVAHVHSLVEAAWQVRSKDEHGVVKRGTFYKSIPLEGADTYSDLAAALSDSIVLLSVDILEAVAPSESKAGQESGEPISEGGIGDAADEASL